MKTIKELDQYCREHNYSIQTNRNKQLNGYKTNNYHYENKERY